jgi:hypothetical protein
MARYATAFVCDDVLISLSGKFNAIGMYTSDIVIPSDTITVNQLVFLFHMECELSDPFKSLVMEVSLPGEEPKSMPIAFAIPPSIEGRTKWTLRWPFLISMAVLRPGRVSTRVLHDQGVIDSGGVWIVKTSGSTPTA